MTKRLYLIVCDCQIYPPISNRFYEGMVKNIFANVAQQISFFTSTNFKLKLIIYKTDSQEFQDYLSDASNFRGHCEGVYFPNGANEISGILREANRTQTRITIAGNRTGLTGSAVPLNGKVIATAKLNRIIEINCSEKYALVEAGVSLAELQARLNELNYFYPPDPTEQNCFIGGTIATNASGARTFKYGSTRNFIDALEIALPNGEIFFLERGKIFAEKNHFHFSTNKNYKFDFSIPSIQMPPTKNTAGYFLKENMDLIDLIIGSEGTLGIVTKAKLKILPLPEKIISCVAFFKSEIDALNFIIDARDFSRSANEKISAARALEYFDGRSLRFLQNDFPKITNDSNAAVWFENEINENEDETLEHWLKLIKANNGNEENIWFASDKKDYDEIHEFRHAISAKANEFVARHGLRKLGTDTAVPDKHFLSFYFDAVNLIERTKINFIIYGHAGNSHLHINFLPTSQSEFETAKKLYSEICRISVSLGGTVSAEHGIGKVKRSYLKMMYDEAIIKEMARIKKIFDPNCILSVGNIFEEDLLAAV